MKKIMMALCAVALLGMTACKDDDPASDNPTGGNGGTEQPDAPDTIPTGEGIYNPGRHISAVAYDDGRESEVWLWQDSKLQSINEGENCGGYTPLYDFTYNGWRLAQTTMYGDLAATVDYSYAGDKLSEITVYAENIEAANIVFGHNTAGKINHMAISVDNTLLNWALQMFGGGFFGVTPLVPQSKMAVDTTAFSVDMAWMGDNVAQMYLTGSITGTVTLGEIQQMVDVNSILGPYASLLAFMDDTTTLPVQVAINDTIGFTYDNQHNPYYGFLGTLNPTNLSANLSANNATAVTTSGAATIVVMLQIPYMGQMPFSIPYPLPTETLVYSYTYDATGYPLTVTDGDGNETQYNYQE